MRVENTHKSIRLLVDLLHVQERYLDRTGANDGLPAAAD